MRRLLLNSTLFPYTTLFRSCKLLDQLLCLPILGPVFKVTFLDVKSIRFCGRHRLGNDDGITELHFPFIVTLARSEEHTSELQSRENLVCRLLLEKKKKSNIA